jgi:DNA-binding transcriptional regulator YiaG
MMVRKPKSVVEQPITSFDQITPDFLLEKERHWEDVMLKEITMNKLNELGQRRYDLIAELESTEAECRIRAIRAINLGFNKKELANLFGVTTQTITKWTKES